MPRRVNLIPMAGAGQRFVEAGYPLPKPLIEIDGLPMIVRAARSLPPADLWIFICRLDHLRTSRIEEILHRNFHPCRIVTVDHLTAGQAATCLLARDELRPDDEVQIGACDNAMLWDRAAFAALWAEGRHDFLVWTFRRNPAVLQDPGMYGWVKTTDAVEVTGVSVKVPISATPMNDHAIVGAFSFRRAALFLDACDDMIRDDARIKNEFYVDQVVNFALARGARGRVWEVDRYICWGTPRDLETYDYWRGCFPNADSGAADR